MSLHFACYLTSDQISCVALDQIVVRHQVRRVLSFYRFSQVKNAELESEGSGNNVIRGLIALGAPA